MIAIPALRGGIGVPGMRIKTRMKQVRYHCAHNPIFADKSGPKMGVSTGSARVLLPTRFRLEFVRRERWPRTIAIDTVGCRQRHAAREWYTTNGWQAIG